MLLTGSFTGCRFRVRGKLPANRAQAFQRGLTRQAFTEIEPRSDKTRTIGWVNARQILDTELSWDKIALGDHLILGLRVDERRVSKPILRARVQQVIGQRLREDAKAKITRDERARIAKSIETEMLAQTPPATKVIELAWNTKAGVVWFASTAKKATEEMMELFEKTFSLPLVPLVPYTLAEAIVEAAGKGGGALDRAEVSDLRPRK
jgi:DNA recombination-dependent growth factor C